MAEHDRDLADVEENGMALQHVRDKTRDLCLAAVKENGVALLYVPKELRENYVLELSGTVVVRVIQIVACEGHTAHGSHARHDNAPTTGKAVISASIITASIITGRHI